MKGKLKISAVRKILWGVLGVIVLALVLGFVGVFSMQMAIEIAIMRQFVPMFVLSFVPSSAFSFLRYEL